MTNFQHELPDLETSDCEIKADSFIKTYFLDSVNLTAIQPDKKAGQFFFLLASQLKSNK